MIADVRRVADDLPATPLFVFLATPDAGEPVFARHWPEAEAVADPDRRLYEAAELPRASLMSVLRPGVLARGVAATFKGHTVGRPRGGDVQQLPGLLLVRPSDGAVLWRYESRHMGDHPDWSRLPHTLQAALEDAAG